MEFCGKRKRIIKSTIMSRRKNGVKKDRVAKLDEINTIDRKLKRNKSEDETNRLRSRRLTLVNQLKTIR